MASNQAQKAHPQKILLVKFLQEQAQLQGGFAALQLTEAWANQNGMSYEAMRHLIRELENESVLACKTESMNHKMLGKRQPEGYAYIVMGQPFMDYAQAFLEENTLQEGSEGRTMNDHLEITFDPNDGKVLLNGIFEIAKPRVDSENYQVIEYLYRNPDRDITKEEIEQHLSTPLQKPFSKILDQLHFQGALKEAFFQLSKTKIRFKQRVSKGELQTKGLLPFPIQVKPNKR
jgi:hypothetical protein